LAIAVVYTIYTVFVIYDIKIETQTIIYYLMAVCFLTSVVYRSYKDRKTKTSLKSNTDNIHNRVMYIDKDKDKNPYPDSLYN